MTRLGWTLLAIGWLGCARAPEVRTSAVDGARESQDVASLATSPRSTLRLRDRLPWPYRLDGVAVWVDDVLLYRGGAPSDGELAALELAPGDHSVRAEATASYRTTPFGDESCPVRITALQGLRVGARPADIRLALFVRGVARDFSERLAFAVEADGASRVAHHALPHQRHDAVMPDSAAASLEALQARLERAREEGDVVQVLCYEDKVSKVGWLLSLRDHRRDLLASSRRDLSFDRYMIAQLDEAVARVYAESNACTGAPNGFATEVLQAPGVEQACASAFFEPPSAGAF